MRIVSDIDGTLLYTHIENGRYVVDDVNQVLIDKLNRHYAQGDLVLLETGRHWNHLEDTLKQVKDAGIKYHTIVLGHIPADVYINDKGLQPLEF